jgi:hypothetical protein
MSSASPGKATALRPPRRQRPVRATAPVLSVARKLPFDYTADEWRRIERACSGGLPAGARRALSIAAAQFCSLGTGGRDQWLRAREATWKRRWNEVHKLTTRLRAAMRFATDSDVIIEPYLKKLDEDLSRLENDAKRYWGGRPVTAMRRELQQEYYTAVLTVWADQLGGKITCTWDPIRGKVKGILIPFFVAVTDPVLGDGAPRNTSLKAIIDREKKRRLSRNLGNGQDTMSRAPHAAH